ncbi:MAG: hypothetical protein LBT62_03015 [Deltaproteobacteria bacterium]|nr:hypothetical protein [Deltaproteobacteria bacterium]
MPQLNPDEVNPQRPAVWRFLLIAVLFYLIIWVIRGLVSPESADNLDADEKELVRDALTGIYFPKNKAITITRSGETFYFSTIDNRDAWLHQNGRQP